MRLGPGNPLSNAVRSSPPSPSTPAALTERRRTGRGLWVPALVSSLALLTVIGGIAAAQFYWRDLRSSMSRMDQTMRHARDRQQQMVEHFSEAQALLIAQQRHLREQEETLRAGEAALAAERMALEDARARLALAAGSRQVVNDQAQGRELARRLDLSLAGIADPGGLESVAETLDAVANWAAASGIVMGSPLRPTLESALGAARDALASARPEDPVRLADRLERLGADATRLTSGTTEAGSWNPASGLSGDAGPGHLGEQIQTALFALRRGDEALFRLALDTTDAWLAAFYNPARPEVASVREQIAEVRRLTVRQDLDAPKAAAAHVRAVLGEMIQRAKTVEQTGDDPPGGDSRAGV